MAKRTTGIHGREGIAGWVFTAPAIAILGVFLFAPIVMALWVSVTNWTGNVDPFGGGPNAAFVGAKNYTALFTQDGLARSNFMQSLGNTFYYVILVVPLQTATALLLALIVNDKFLRGKSFFRTAFYFPSVTSSIAISTAFLFLFSNTGSVNGLLKLVGINGPQWFSDPRGLLHLLTGLFGAGDNPAWGRGRSSDAPCGTGCPAPRWPCASSSSLPSGPQRAPSCLCSWPRYRTCRSRLTRPR